MFRIVEVHPCDRAAGEYVVLQAHGIRALDLREWAVCSDAWESGDPALAARELHIFRDEVIIRPGTRVVLFTGPGATGWHPTNDGRPAFVVFAGRAEPLWRTARALHVLHVAGSQPLDAPDERGDRRAA